MRPKYSEKLVLWLRSVLRGELSLCTGDRFVVRTNNYSRSFISASAFRNVVIANLSVLFILVRWLVDVNHWICFNNLLQGRHKHLNTTVKTINV